MSSAFAIGTLLVGQVALAAPFSYKYTDTISGGTLPTGLATGDAAEIVVTLDNGGTSCQSQTWTSAHLQSVTFKFKSTVLVTTFTTPFGGGLDAGSDDFVSDANGNLTTVMGDWSDDNSVGTNFTTNGNSPTEWYLNGYNSMYYTSSEDIALTNVGNMLTASNWSISSAGCGSTTVSAPIFDLNKPAQVFATEVEETK